MTVASGQFVYEYTTNGYGDEFNFFLPGSRDVLAPSSILIEEIMYAVNAESNRGAESIGWPTSRGLGGVRFSRHNTTASSARPLWSGRMPKWVNEQASISGLFDPSPTGGHLDGTLPVSGNAPANQPAHISSRWLYDIKLQFRDVIAYISRSSSSSQQEIFQDWFRFKGYTDTYAQSGFFFKEDIDLTESDNNQFEDESPHWGGSYCHDTLDSDEYQLMFKQSGVFNGTWLSSRHLNEVRIQPIPYINGSSGTLTTVNGHDKSNLILSPLKPNYARTDGTLSYGYSNVTLYGDVLVSGMTIMTSGNGSISYHENIHTPSSPTWSAIPNSCTFTMPALSAGFYRIGLGMNHDRDLVGNSGMNTSGLFPWASIFADAYKCATWPRMDRAAPDNYTYLGESEAIFVDNQNGLNNDLEALVITNYIWASQPDVGGISQSGIDWYCPVDIAGNSNVLLLDFYDATGTPPAQLSSQDMQTVWGREFQLISLIGGGSWGGKGWEHKQSDGKIYRCHTSGSSSTLPGDAGTTAGGELGAFVSVWNIPLQFSSLNVYSTGSITRGGSNYYTEINKFVSLSWDGSNWVCGGTHTHSHDITGPLVTQYTGSTYFLNSSYNLSKAVGQHAYTGQHTTNPYHSSQVVNLRYINTTSEYLAVGGVRYSPAGEGGLATGCYSVATFQWTGGGTPAYDDQSGLMTETFYIPTWGDNGSDYAENVMDLNNKSAMIITDFFENEANDKVYAFCISNPSGGSTNRGRYVSELDTSSHPYTLNRTWRVTSEAAASTISLGLDRTFNSNFIQELDY